MSKNLAEAASELIEHKPLRFGYDQLLPMSNEAVAGKNAYAALLSKTATLQDISCIQGVLCGLILCLKAAQQPPESASSTIFPFTAGSGVMFAPDVPIAFGELAKRQGYIYLMLAYTEAKAVYRLQPEDPHAYDFKQLGYNFGDRLSDKLNPLVYV